MPESEQFSDFTAAIPEPYQILGLPLLPLSLGRYRLLHRFGVDFVSEEETTAGLDDLILGVIICSMRCDHFLAFYQSKEFASEIRKWAHSIGAYPPFWMRGKYGKIISASFIGRRWRKNHSFNFVEKMNLFKNYIAASQRIPEYAATSEAQRNSSAHWSSNVENLLRSHLNWTEEEINEAPLIKALFDYFNYLETEGLVKIFTDADMEMGRANAAALEAYAKALGTNVEQLRAL